MPKPKGRIQFMTARFDGGSDLEADKPTQLSHGRPLWEPSPGRPRKFDTETEQRMQERLRKALQYLLEHTGKLPNPKKAVDAVRKIAAEENIRSSPRTLKRRITEPVLREFRRSK
jgi:hypothetical protein